MCVCVVVCVLCAAVLCAVVVCVCVCAAAAAVCVVCVCVCVCVCVQCVCVSVCVCLHLTAALMCVQQVAQTVWQPVCVCGFVGFWIVVHSVGLSRQSVCVHGSWGSVATASGTTQDAVSSRNVWWWGGGDLEISRHLLPVRAWPGASHQQREPVVCEESSFANW